MVYIQTNIISLATYDLIIDIILRNLSHEDKRNLFLTNKQLQTILRTNYYMRAFTTQTITFRFPQTPFHKKGKPHYGKPNNIKPTYIKKHVNPQASLTECQTCDTPYYNALFEKTFMSCDLHSKYKWQRTNTKKTPEKVMTISATIQSKKGHKITSKQPFFPNCGKRIPTNANN